MKMFLFVVLALFSINQQAYAISFAPIPKDAAGYEWMDDLIEKEFSPFNQRGITKQMYDATLKINEKGFQRFKIINSKVYGPDIALKKLLKQMVEYYDVPDVDFIYRVGDVPRNSDLDNIAPVFAGAKNENNKNAICFCDGFYSNKYDWQSIVDEINESQEIWSWKKKISKLFWRGKPSDGRFHPLEPRIGYSLENWYKFPRGSIVALSSKYPDLIDAAFNTVFPSKGLLQAKFNSERKKLLQAVKPVPYVPMRDHLQYKYQLIVDGNTCSFPGTQWRFLSGCLPMKQESANIMWFFGALKPWVHYIPLEHDLSDALDKVKWAKKHDENAHQIAQNAREFALTHLMPEHLLLYCYKALVKYASLQKYKTKLE